ncbi:hypothetical protein VV869_22870 [Photobacterium sp. MCCC 1A19761]|uniref:hypothetical protein n=1 Tax=Photobacterium sp. MCCC 1A19761 TaxID=3115000 RepID=UPI00307E2104
MVPSLDKLFTGIVLALTLEKSGNLWGFSAFSHSVIHKGIRIARAEGSPFGDVGRILSAIAANTAAGSRCGDPTGILRPVAVLPVREMAGNASLNPADAACAAQVGEDVVAGLEASVALLRALEDSL